MCPWNHIILLIWKFSFSGKIYTKWKMLQVSYYYFKTLNSHTIPSACAQFFMLFHVPSCIEFFFLLLEITDFMWFSFFSVNTFEFIKVLFNFFFGTGNNVVELNVYVIFFTSIEMNFYLNRLIMISFDCKIICFIAMLKTGSN